MERRFTGLWLGLGVLLGGILAVILSSCALLPTKPVAVSTVVNGYSEVGQNMFDVGLILRIFEKAEVLKGTDLVQAKKVYADSKTIYIQAGDSLVGYMEEKNATLKQVKFDNYHNSIRSIAKLYLDYTNIEQPKGDKSIGEWITLLSMIAEVSNIARQYITLPSDLTQVEKNMLKQQIKDAQIFVPDWK